MNLTINKLPTRTWNRLGMNETKLALEDAFESFSPAAVWDENQVHWEPSAAAEVLPTGVVGELSAMTAEAAVGFAETKPDAVMTQPLVLTYRYEAGAKAISRLVLHAGARSLLKVILLVGSAGADVSALQTEIYADADAKVEIYVAELLAADSIGLHNMSGICADRAHVNLTRLDLGAAQFYMDAELDLRGVESAFHTEIGYHVVENQVLDMNYVALHKGKNTESLMEVNGTLEENAKKIFRGTIDFQKGCAGAKGTENENVLLLGEEMVNQTIPLILCAEEDVEGNHGASIGQLDDKVLFYLGSRGISEQAAQQIVALSRIESVCTKFPDEGVQNDIREFESHRGISHVAEL